MIDTIVFSESESITEEMSDLLSIQDISVLACKVVALAIKLETQEMPAEKFYQTIGGVIMNLSKIRKGFYDALKVEIQNSKQTLDEMSELRRTRCILYNQV
ncbi:hypothetical protein HY483_04045 [Candidatus Woesearchaeota archaeon]|nr:hypothetical protein [Candidatus Woesearchaeota archaeon]